MEHYIATAMQHAENRNVASRYNSMAAKTDGGGMVFVVLGL
jgi:hypothetical protein